MLRKVRGDTASTSNFRVTITLPDGFRIRKVMTAVSVRFDAGFLVSNRFARQSETTVSHLMLRGTTSVRTRLFRPWTYLLGT